MSTPKQSESISRANIREACRFLAADLGEIKYALLGGAACQLLGSSRQTEDVDFVVPRDGVKPARALIAADKDHFTVDRRTLHTYYKSAPPVEIKIICPPGTFRETFDANTATHAIDVDGTMVRVLHPLLILNAKCRSLLGRPSKNKKEADAADIAFLLEWLAERKIRVTPEKVPNASEDFVAWFISAYGSSELWKKAQQDG